MRNQLFRLAITCGLAGWILACGCAPLPQPDDPESVELAGLIRDRGKSAVAAGESGSFELGTFVTRGGQRMKSIVLVAPVAVRADLSGLSGRFALRLSVAPVFNLGDGMQMEILLRTNGEGRPLYSRYFDAGRRAGDRKWTTLEIPLDLDRKSDLEIRVSGGPQGDLITDWLALAEARLVPIDK